MGTGVIINTLQMRRLRTPAIKWQKWAWNPYLPVSRPSRFSGKQPLLPLGCLPDHQPSLPCPCLPVKVILDNYFFLCGQPFLFIPREQVCDGHQDCASGEDEKYCVKKLPDGPPVAGESRGQGARGVDRAGSWLRSSWSTA